MSTEYVVIPKSDWQAILDKLREKTGNTALLTSGEVESEIDLLGMGSNEGEIDTSDATATEDEIFLDKTVYARGKKLTGTFTIDSELTGIEAKIVELKAILNSKAGASAGGYSVAINLSASGGTNYDVSYYYVEYSVDGGITWTKIRGYIVVVSNATQIMFKPSIGEIDPAYSYIGKMDEIVYDDYGESIVDGVDTLQENTNYALSGDTVIFVNFVF